MESGQPGGFYVCDKCGATAPAGSAPIGANHERPYFLPARGVNSAPKRCNGTQRPVFLGYQFGTDVLLMHIPLRSPFLFDLTRRETRPALLSALNSLANALALTAASELDVDARELQCGIRLQRRAQGDSFADVYIYDTLAGGAGYSRLVGTRFQEIFSAAVERLEACSCDSSCTNCLRTYGNRMLHASLNRHLAIDLAQYSEHGRPPALYDLAVQRQRLAPLKSMLELDEWNVASTGGAAFEIVKAGARHSLILTPSLFDQQSVPAEWQDAIAFSQYDIDNDLPSCLLKIP